MALVRNLSRTGRTLRIVMRALSAVAAVLLRAQLFGAVLLCLAGLVILVEGTISH